MSTTEDFGSQKVKSAGDGQTVELKSLWQDQSVAIVFFRRWGCMLCRLWAKELSEISPVLKKHNIKLVGVGVDDNGVKEFVDNKFFDGDLYYVESQSTYKTLGFKHYNNLSIITSLFSKQAREKISKGQKMHLGNNLKGDWGQIGGALLVEKGGKIHCHFKQSGPGDHLSNLDILKCFGSEFEYNAEKMANDDSRKCTEDPKP